MLTVLFYFCYQVVAQPESFLMICKYILFLGDSWFCGYKYKFFFSLTLPCYHFLYVLHRVHIMWLCSTIQNRFKPLVVFIMNFCLSHPALMVFAGCKKLQKIQQVVLRNSEQWSATTYYLQKNLNHKIIPSGLISGPKII